MTLVVENQTLVVKLTRRETFLISWSCQIISHRATRNEIWFVESESLGPVIYESKWIDQDYWIERAWFEILIALGLRLTFWLTIGCGLDEQPFNFMGRKLLNLPKNSFSNAKYANDLIKWHKLCHMINHVIILIQHFRYVSDRINSYNFWRVLFVVVMDQRTKPINCTGPNFRGPIIHECSIGWDTIVIQTKPVETGLSMLNLL